MGPDPKIIHDVLTCSWSLVVLFWLLGEGVHASQSQVHFEDEDLVYRQNKEPGHAGRHKDIFKRDFTHTHTHTHTHAHIKKQTIASASNGS